MAREQQQQQGQSQEVEAQGGGGAGIQRAEAQKGQLAAERPSRGMRRAEVSSPFSMMSRLMEDMDRLVSGFGFGIPSVLKPFEEEIGGALTKAAWSPTIETFERDGCLVVRADLPGLKPEDVKIEVSGDELVISGERTENKEETRGGRRYSERSYGSFERRFTLPEGCDPEKVEASFENGVLEVSLAAPEREKPRTRKVQIKGAAPQAQGKGEAEPVH